MSPQLIPALLSASLVCLSALADPLPSWSDTEARARIIDFVERVTDPASPDYVTPADRIATFDNDGTLWSERPIYFQAFFAMDRLRQMAAEDPDILTSDTLRAAAAGDLAGLAAGGKTGLIELVTVTHSGVTVDAFIRDVQDWLATARHPETGLPYEAMVYQPMLELLRYLRDEGFSTWIATGGGVHFVRAFAERTYGIPPSQVIGSVGASSYALDDGAPVIMKDPALLFIDDGPGKPVAVDARIGKRPIFAAGNSDGDFEMLEWATTGEGLRLGILIHHTDAEREFAYEIDGVLGGLDRGLEEGPERGWLIVDMARDWRQIWPGR